MKTIITVLVLLVIGVGSMQAQESLQKPTLSKKAAVSTAAQTIIKQLNLDERKTANVTKIMGAFEDMRRRVTQSSKTPAQKTQALSDINQREKANLKNILDDAQYTKYIELASSLKKG